MQLFLACKICKYRVYFCCLEWSLWWLWPMHRMGGGGVHTKYFWVTQYWLLLVTLVQLSQLFSIFTTSPTSPNHSQSRVCKYLTLIELFSPFWWRHHLWGACSLSSEVWTKTINKSFLQRLFCPFYQHLPIPLYLISVNICSPCLLCWLCSARGGLRADPCLAPVVIVCSGNIWPSSNLYLCYNLETNCGNKELYIIVKWDI